ncbi:hypothetical protein TSUD_306250 [Trifolium subterraneum]|uniref:Uncharacterized protein n=1 Tax=Trifolium subterraneum TaxID=3900 RepID=A0A2Z6N295_TRISU|nr:hypothetical protein TSUD_306250 [Trifolium subterraneum]
MAVAIQSLSCARLVTVGGNRSFPLQRKPLLFSTTLSSPSRNLIVTASKKKNKKEKTSHVTKGNDKEEDAFEMLFKRLGEALKIDDLSKDDSGDDHVTDEDIALFERELKGVLGELLNSDTGETQAENDAEKNSGDRNENSLFRRELDGMLGEFEGLLGELEGSLGELDAELLNSDSSKTQADNDAEKNSGDGNKKSLFRRELDGMLGEFEGLLGELEGALGEFDSSKTQADNDGEKSSGDGNENSLFKRELEAVSGEFDTDLLNSDTIETQVVNDAKKSSSDGNENSPKLRSSKLNKLVRALKTRSRKTSKNVSHVTEGNDEEEDAFEMVLKQLEEALKNDDLSKDDSGDDDITEEEIALFERKLEGVLGDFKAGSLNSDSSETQADNDAEKNSGDGYDNSLMLRTCLSSISCMPWAVQWNVIPII